MGDNTFTLTRPPTLAILRVSSKDALRFLRDGVGTNRSIESLTPIRSTGGGPEEVLVKVVAPGKVQIAGLDFSSICGTDGQTKVEHVDPPGEDRKEKHGVILRSVLSMFRYLGQAQAFETRRQLEQCRTGGRDDARPVLFKIRVACSSSAVPPYNVAFTSFLGRDFFIPTGGDVTLEDRTLETLSLLSYLVGLQTSEASLRGTTPFVTVTQ